MKKFKDMEAWELMTALAEMAEPVNNIVSDDELWETFKECTKRGLRLKQKDGLQYILKTYGKLAPKLLGEHKADTLKILSIVEGKKLEDLMHMNGAELLKDFTAVYKEQLESFFTKPVLLGKTE